MQFSALGHCGTPVSRACLGTMTWGTQNNQQDANEQIEYALDQGINFIDTAELYSVPPTPDSYGATETLIGNWLAANPGRREEFVLASKIAGNGLKWIRAGGNITGEAVLASVDASLARLQTDYIDLYQLHWPNRRNPHFGRHAVGRLSFDDIKTAAQSAEKLEILQAIDECVKVGKIRHFGLSDDTPWGINEYIRLSEKHNLARVTAIQNEFSLLHTKDWPYLIENCVREALAYLPWSPLATGMLTGKYLNGARPEGSRWCMAARHGLFRDNPASSAAIEAYVALAKKYKLTPAQLALAWVNQVPGVTSTIIGATSLAQLKDNLSAFDLRLNSDLLSEISEVLAQYPQPF